MRIGLIADLHGNLPALEAVLAELASDGVGELVCLGDVAVGPQPAETLERLDSLGCPVVVGNWDAWFADRIPPLPGDVGRRVAELGRWWARRLDPARRRRLGSFPPTVELDLPAGGRLLACHGSPRSFDDGILATTPDDELERMLDGAEAELVVAGHTHVQLVRRVGERLLVNPGSVGLPFRRPAAGAMPIAPWAEYGLLTVADGRLSVELRRTAYDVTAWIAFMRGSGMPHAEWWTGLWQTRQGARAVV